MHIDHLLETLRENGARIFSAAYSESFDMMIGRTKEYLAICRASQPRDVRAERDLGGSWLASASFGSADPSFSEICYRLGIALCRADSHSEPSTFARTITETISARASSEPVA